MHWSNGRHAVRVNTYSQQPKELRLGYTSLSIARSEDFETRINEDIRAYEVRLVAPDGEQIGIKALPEALDIARDMDLDLVEVAPTANPPVCRIMDYGKFKYEAAQRAKETRRKATHSALKEMKYRPKIGKGDFATKTAKVQKFLSEGHKVKITIMFRGRELAHPELGQEILERVAQEIAHLGKVDQFPRQDGRNMTMVLSPDRQVRQRRKDDGGNAAPSGHNGVLAPESPESE